MTAPDRELIDVAVFGGQGYVAGELLRILSLHPRFRVAAVFSTSQGGESVTASFPHLAGTTVDGLTFRSQDEHASLFHSGRPVGLFFATPHGATASLADRVLSAAEAARADAKAVDLSADFRFRDPARYAAIYAHEHEAPGRLPQFVCAVPEHFRGRPPAHATQPGCFTTAVTVAAFPFFAADLVEADVFVAAVTGSSGSGRTPAQNTHHPERSGNLYAYNPLGHRHEAEMRMLIGAARPGAEPDVQFVPHSGPFVRGIHATLRMTLKRDANAKDLASAVNAFYGEGFVRASTIAPKLTEVVGTNRVRIGVATRGRTLVVTSVVDNLTKGAAGGGVQWMNRLFDLDDSCGLKLPGLGWA